jgi:NADPH:quinone reductase
MRAWQVKAQGEPADVIEEVDVGLSPPGPHELQVRVIASTLALPDVLLCRGLYRLLPPVPFTPGLEFVGTVVAVGSDVTTPIGAKVMGVSSFFMGNGAFADECKAYEAAVFPVPAGMSDVDAAGFTIAYHTAYFGLVRRAKLQAGETVLVHGAAGGTGFAAIMLAKALGARVIATAGGAERAAACLELGADVAIDHTAVDFVDAVNRATNGRGADIVFDPVGGETFERSADCTAPEGRLLPIGFASGRWGTLESSVLTRKNISIVGVMPAGFAREEMLSMHDALSELYNKGAIKMLIDRTIGFADIRNSLQDIADRKTRGRIVAIH